METQVKQETGLYCTITPTGNRWIFAVKPGTTVTSLGNPTNTVCGYGNVLSETHNMHPIAVAVPIIDTTGDEAAFKVVLDVPDTILPKEADPGFATGTLEGYLNYLEKNGVRVLRPGITIDEYKYRKQFIEENGREFAANEGICLQCLCSTKLVKVDGLPHFLAEYDDELHGTTWEESEFLDDVGAMFYKCPHGHKTEVYVSKHGDYVAA